VAAVLHPEIRAVALVRLRVGLGDLLCGVPALRALRARLPHAHIALVTYAEMAPVVARWPHYVDELLAFPGHPGIPERPCGPDWDREWAGFRAAARGRFDLALQCYGANAAANEVTAALGARRTGGFFVPGAWAPDDLEASVPYPEHLHEVDRHLHLLAHLGAPARGGRLELPVTPAEEESHRELLAAEDLRPGGYALLHPGATSPSRRWPLARLAAVAAGLAARGLAVAVTGVEDERPLVDELRRLARVPTLDLCGRTTLGGAAALVRDARLLVANDTGIAHVAAATGTPSVTVFLSGDPRRFGSRDPERHRIARVQVECNPCHHLTCPIDHRCAGALTPDMVLAQVDALLAGPAPGGPRARRAAARLAAVGPG
jgi:ADP-heptose:LPS heptosyltransferase